MRHSCYTPPNKSLGDGSKEKYLSSCILNAGFKTTKGKKGDCSKSRLTALHKFF